MLTRVSSPTNLYGFSFVLKKTGLRFDLSRNQQTQRVAVPEGLAGRYQGGYQVRP